MSANQQKILANPDERRVLYISGFILLLWAISVYNYLLFHTIAELWSIVIAILVSVIVWNSRERLDNTYLLIIGVAYAYVAVFDVLHTLTYSGMNIITGYGTDLPTQLWLLARFVEAFSLFAALFFLNRRVMFWRVNAAYIVFSLSALALVFVFRVFPDAYVAGQGLTDFKVYTEYLISGLLFLALFLLYRKRQNFHKTIFMLLTYSIAFTIISELIFTLYINVFGFFNLLGHFSKIVSFYFIYLAIAKAGIVRPQESIFRKLADREERLAQANRAKSEFVYFISHQLKNPLTSIQLTADLLKKDSAGSLTSPQKQYISEIEGSADKIKELINTYLKLARLETGTLPNEPEPLDVNIQFKKLTSTYQRQLEQKKLRCELDISSDTPVIFMDGHVFELIFDNLLSNAINYTQSGTITVRSRVKDNVLMVTVADTGQGIPPDARDKIFTKAFRAGNTRAAKSKGTGLGLYMVKLAVDIIGARINVKSQEGQGTSFTVSLPLDKFKA